jgi:hypothetical protein
MQILEQCELGLEKSFLIVGGCDIHGERAPAAAELHAETSHLVERAMLFADQESSPDFVRQDCPPREGLQDLQQVVALIFEEEPAESPEVWAVVKERCVAIGALWQGKVGDRVRQGYVSLGGADE